MCNERPAEDRSDTDLVAAAQQEPAAFVALYERYFPRVYGYVRLRVKSQATCEDVTSQVFTTALAKIHTLRPEGNVGAWLFTVARNAVLDTYRHSRPMLGGEEALGSVPDPDPSPEERVLTAERAAELRMLLATLRPEQQDLLALRYGAGLSFPEIAQIVGKNPIAVRVSVHRILAGVRRRLPHEE